MFVPIQGSRVLPALMFFFLFPFLADEGRKAPTNTIRGVHLSHFAIFLLIGFQKMLIMFLRIEHEFSKI